MAPSGSSLQVLLLVTVGTVIYMRPLSVCGDVHAGLQGCATSVDSLHLPEDATSTFHWLVRSGQFDPMPWDEPQALAKGTECACCGEGAAEVVALGLRWVRRWWVLGCFAAVLAGISAVLGNTKRLQCILWLAADFLHVASLGIWAMGVHTNLQPSCSLSHAFCFAAASVAASVALSAWQLCHSANKATTETPPGAP